MVVGCVIESGKKLETSRSEQGKDETQSEVVTLWHDVIKDSSNITCKKP